MSTYAPPSRPPAVAVNDLPVPPVEDRPPLRLVEGRPASYQIRRAAPSDRATLLLLLERWVTTRDARRRYEWIYEENPEGPAASWLAVERATGQIVGFTSIFPRGFRVDGLRVVGGVGFDAFVRPDHRRRGIVLALHRASFEAMASGDVPFRFMCGPPVRANLEALKKAGTQVAGAVRYLSIPLNAHGLLAMLRCDRGPALASRARALEPLVRGFRRLVMGTAGGGARIRRVLEVDERFDDLWRRVLPRFHVIGRRDAVWLQWRFLRNPVCEQRLLAIERGAELLGWAVIETAGKGMLLVDHLLPTEPLTASDALGALLHHVSGLGASRLTLRASLRSRYGRFFLAHNFLPGWHREDFQVLCPVPALREALGPLAGWHLSTGDLNPESSPWSVNSAPDAEWTDPNYRTTHWAL